MSIAEQAQQLFVAGKYEELLSLAVEHWPRELGEVTPDQAEAARFARIAAYKLGRSADVHLWQARSVAGGAASRNLRSLALSIQTHVYALLEIDDLEGAHCALDVVEQLSHQDSEGEFPSQDLVARIVADRRALLCSSDGQWEEASRWYSVAKSLTEINTRDYVKVSGAEAVARWRAGGSNEQAVESFRALMEMSDDWTDMRTAATQNYDAASRGDRSAAVPFDLL